MIEPCLPGATPNLEVGALSVVCEIDVRELRVLRAGNREF
jgi:hypothetical protein